MTPVALSDEPALLHHDPLLDHVETTPRKGLAAGPAHDASTFYGLVEEGCSYGVACYGDTYKVVLMGSETFQKRGVNLLCSYGRSWAVRRVSETITTVVSGRRQTIAALTLYLHTQMVAEQVRALSVYDEDGSCLFSPEPDHEALHDRAALMATQFYATFERAYAQIDEEGNDTSGAGVITYSMGNMRNESPTDFS